MRYAILVEAQPKAVDLCTEGAALPAPKAATTRRGSPRLPAPKARRSHTGAALSDTDSDSQMKIGVLRMENGTRISHLFFFLKRAFGPDLRVTICRLYGCVSQES